MVEAVTSCQPLFVLGSGMRFRPEKLKVKLKKDNRCHYAKAVLNSKQQPKKDHKKPLTVNLSTTIDAPLYESPEKEWRIQMPTMQFLFLSIYFTFYIKLRYKSMGKDYPPLVPHHIPKIIELELTRWELGGISEEYLPRDLSVSLKGTIYPDREQGTQSRLRSHFEMNLSFIPSPLLGWLPHSVMQGLTEALVKKAMVDSTSNARLLEDYNEFKAEKLKKV
ncbi:hypothetical protein ACLB2K_061809 [Fragaria x ananassa]